MLLAANMQKDIAEKRKNMKEKRRKEGVLEWKRAHRLCDS